MALVYNIVLLAATWLLLRMEKKNLSAIGIELKKQRVLELVGGFFLMVLLCIPVFLLQGKLSGFNWQLNDAPLYKKIAGNLWYSFNSVLWQELVFRGYLFYKAIQLLGKWKAILLFTVISGIFHWHMIGFNLAIDPAKTAILFFAMGAAGFLYAVAFAQTNSIAAPFGLHLAYNVILFDVFVQSAEDNHGLLKLTNAGATSSSFTPELVLLALSGVMFLIVSLFYLRRNRNLQSSLV